MPDEENAGAVDPTIITEVVVIVVTDTVVPSAFSSVLLFVPEVLSILAQEILFMRYDILWNFLFRLIHWKKSIQIDSIHFMTLQKAILS